MPTWGWVLVAAFGVVAIAALTLLDRVYGRLAEARDAAKQAEKATDKAIAESSNFQAGYKRANERIGDLEHQLAVARSENQYATSQNIVDTAMEAACLLTTTLGGRAVATGMLRCLERYEEEIVNGLLPGLQSWAIAAGQAVDRGESPLRIRSAYEAAQKFGELDGHAGILDDIFEWLEELADEGDAESPTQIGKAEAQA